jgi:hypothetical protein
MTEKLCEVACEYNPQDINQRLFNDGRMLRPSSASQSGLAEQVDSDLQEMIFRKSISTESIFGL